MGFLRSSKPLDSVIRDRKRAALVGVAIKARYDAEKANQKEGVTKLPVLVPKLWNKYARRYRYDKDVVIRGVKVGGRFTEAPDHAPADRKRKGKRRVRKKRAST